MASQLYVPGPARIFVGTGAAQALQYLGVTQEGVNINIRGNWAPVISDIAGPTSPVDRQYFPQGADFTYRLTYYNEPVLSAYAVGVFGGIEGTVNPNQAGSLIVQESLGFPMAIVAPYATKTVYSTTMVSGYYFPVTFAEDKMIPVSTRTKLPEVTTQAQWVWSPVTLSATLYSNTLPSLPAVN